MKVILIFITLILTSKYTWSSPSSYLGVMRINGDEESRGLVEFGVRGHVDKVGFLSGSLMLFDFGEKTYEGINMAYGIGLGRYSKIYLTAGGFLGKYEECDEEKTTETEDGEEVKRCTYDFTGGFYPEVGIELDFFGLRVASYARYYKTFERINDEHFLYGVSVGWAIQ